MLRNLPLTTRALVCASSNKAVANIIQRGRFKTSEAVVYGSSDQIDESLHPYEHLYRSKSFDIDTYTTLTSYDYLSTEEQLKWTPALVEMAVHLKLDKTLSEKMLHPEYRATVDEDEQRAFMKQLRTLAQTEYSVLNENASRYVFSTVASSGLKDVEDQQFDIAFIDEAGQASEAETTIIIRHRNLKHLVLVGDPMQLTAVVRDTKSLHAGLGCSLMERLARSGYYMHLLNTQYRMAPCISQFPSNQFYNQRLTNGSCVHHLETATGYKVVQVVGHVSQDRTNLSNRIEADIVERIARAVLRQGVNVTIGIITPYVGQRKLLEDAFRDVLNVVTIGTVDSFQGQERDVIVVSTVRTRSLHTVGFLGEPRRMNVALTRAGRKLVIVGDIEFLAHNDKTWNMLWQNAIERNVVSRIKKHV